MSAYLLVYANKLLGSHIEGNTPPVIIERGAIAGVRYVADGWGNKELLPNFVHIRVDVPIDKLEQYAVAWNRELEWSVISSDLVKDEFRVRIYSANPGSGQGAVTKDEIEQFLTDWNATIVSFDTNEVVADFNIYSSSISKGFFGLAAVAAVTFTEVSYDQPTATHVISANYTATGANAINVDKKLRAIGASIVSHVGKVVTYEVERSDLSARFKAALQQFGALRIQKTKYSIAETAVDAAIASGGIVDITEAQLLTNLVDNSAAI